MKVCQRNRATTVLFAKEVLDFAYMNAEINKGCASGVTDYEIASRLIDFHTISFEIQKVTEILSEYVEGNMIVRLLRIG